MASDTTERNIASVRVPSMHIQVHEITRVDYNNARKKKDYIAAENKYGFVLVSGDQHTLYVNHKGKCYWGVMPSWNTPDQFLELNLEDVKTTTSAYFYKPEDK